MKTVLIVEDEKLIRQGLRKMIQRSGVPVEVIMECNNGETALEILKEQSIDVMFTDIRMPKMDGIELVERMQECEHIPLTVAISGYDDFNYATIKCSLIVGGFYHEYRNHCIAGYSCRPHCRLDRIIFSRQKGTEKERRAGGTACSQRADRLHADHR